MADIHNVISLGIGSPASIPYFLLLGLTPNPDVVPPFTSSIDLTGSKITSLSLTGSKKTSIGLTGSKVSGVDLEGTRT